MKYENAGQMNFFSEMAEHQISAREFFSNVLLDSLDRNFGLKHVLYPISIHMEHFFHGSIGTESCWTVKSIHTGNLLQMM